MIKTPLFIVFEGIDGSGKSTQAALLYNHLVSNRVPVVMLAEPSSGEWGIQIRKMLKGEAPASPQQQLELFLKDREDDVVRNIRPSLDRGKIVVMDRYYYSNAVYQGAAGLSPEKIISKNMQSGFPAPDRVYLIDLPPAIAATRIDLRRDQKREIFEREPFLDKVRAAYRTIADDRFLIIDGNLPEDKIFKKIKEDIEDLFSLPTKGQ